MNRSELRSEVGFLLNFNEGQADQDFSTSRLNKAVQYVYELELEQAKQIGMSHWFRKTQNISWPSGQVTLELPSSLDQANLIGIYDITNANPGNQIVIRETAQDNGDAFWLDYKTLQWASTGPSEDKTLQVHYLARAETLAGDADSPTLIPPQFHWVLVWSAATYLRKIADEDAPQSWMSELKDWRHRYWKFLTRGRPLSDTPTITNSFTNNDVGELY